MKKFPVPNVTVKNNGSREITFPTQTVGPLPPSTTVAPPHKPTRSDSLQASHISGKPLIQHLDTTDMSYIFETTLRPEHRSNPTVLAFIREYIQNRDVEATCKEIGISKRDGINLRNRKDIYECIAKITELSVLKHGIDPDELVKKVLDVAYFDPADVVDKSSGAAITNLHDIPVESRRAIKKMKIKNLFDLDENGMQVVIGELVEFEFWDKLKASEMVGREVGKFKESMVVEHGVTRDMKSILLESRKRGEEAAGEVRDVVEVGDEK